MIDPQRAELHRAQQWSAAVARTLDEMTDHVATAARRLAEGWPDARGQEWTERLLVLRHALHRDADAAVELGRAIDVAANAPSSDDGSPSYGGPLLGSTGGRHVDDRRGVTIPRLNDGADDGG